MSLNLNALWHTHHFLRLAQSVINHVRTDVRTLPHSSLLWCLKHASVGNALEMWEWSSGFYWLWLCPFSWAPLMSLPRVALCSSNVTVGRPKLFAQMRTCFQSLTPPGSRFAAYLMPGLCHQPQIRQLLKHVINHSQGKYGYVSILPHVSCP